MRYRFKPSKARLLAGVSALAITMSYGAVQAQEVQDASDLPFDTIVTVGKRPESVQNVPVAMTAYNAAFVKRVNLDDVKDLIKFSPGFAGDSKDSFIDFVNVRGISTNDYGIGGDPSIGFFKNNLYQGRQGSAVSSLFDLERAEVLRGPQGFLFGRNAISGAISFHTAKPDFDGVTKGYVDVGIGERGIFEAEAAVTLPVSDNFAIRVAGYTSHENGFVTNTFMPNADKLGGHDKTAGRVTFAMRGETWDANFIAEYEDRKQSGTIYRAVEDDVTTPMLQAAFGADILPKSDLRTFHSDLNLGNYDIGQIFSLSSEINIDLEFAKLTSITGYKDHNYKYAEDYDGMSIGYAGYAQDQDGSYFEQEIRLVSQTDSPLSWYVGASYYKEKIDANFAGRADEDVLCGAYYYSSYGYSNCSDLYYYYGGFTTIEEGLLETGNARGTYSGWAAYVDLTWAVSDRFDLGFGGRYTQDTKEFGLNVPYPNSELGPWYTYGFATDPAVNGGYIDGKRKWSAFTPRFIARYRPNDDIMMYASVTKGYKAGGFGTFAANLVLSDEFPTGTDEGIVVPGAVADSFEPEEVWSYEVGVKGKLAGGDLRYDLATYYYNYTDLQLGYWAPPQRIANIGKVKAYGIEGSVQAVLSDNIDIILSGSSNFNEISGAESIEPGSDGNRLSGAPKYKGSGIISYHTPIQNGELNFSAEIVAQSSVFVGIGNIEAGRIESWSDVSLRIGYTADSGFGITAYAENIFDSAYYDGGYEGSEFFPTILFGISRPRTFGVKMSWSFGG